MAQKLQYPARNRIRWLSAERRTQVPRLAYANVRVRRPAEENFVPYRDYISSQLELLHVETG